MGVRAALAVLLLFVATVSAQGGVTFWRKEFTLTCPDEGIGWKFYMENNKQFNSTENTYTTEYDNKKKGLYYCEYGTDTPPEKYYFYVQGKVCENCFELDGTLFMVAIFLDAFGTAVLMLLIWKCTKKKSSAGHATFTPKAPGRSGGRGPPVPSPDYEQLNMNTRSQDPYAMVNRTG